MPHRRDAWATVDLDDPLARKVEQLSARGMTDSKLASAQRRLAAVDQAGVDLWVVAGDPSLGDTRSEYAVTFADGRYRCDGCDPLYGDARRAPMCSHVLAVILWRAQHPVPPVTSRMFADKHPWPEWVQEFRPQQWQATMRAVREFRAGRKVVILGAPTGFGKSLAAEMARRILRTRALYLTVTKTLQDQLQRDFPYARLLKGRSNYPTLDYPQRFRPPDCLSAADCDKRRIEGTDRVEYECTWCHSVPDCPYEVAKREALRSQLAVTNVAYFLAEANHVGKLQDWPLVVVDECDELEAELLRHIEVSIPAYWQRRLRLGRPERVTDPQAWEAWVGRALLKIRQALAELPARPSDLDTQRARRTLAHMQADLERVQGHLADESWVYAGIEEPIDAGRAVTIVFKPVTVGRYAHDVLWQHADRFLLMSATVISAEQIAQDLGLRREEWAYIESDSPFPAERRPIYIVSRAALTHDTEAATWPTVRETVDEILDRYTGHRVLVHTVSYRRAERLLAQSRHAGRMLTYRTAYERTEAVERFRQTPGAVLVAPSLERGVDLPNDACRAILIVKVAYPDCGDRQVRARLKLPGGRGWYIVQTIRNLVQMTGRGMRHRDDWVDSYIVDKQFLELWRRHRNLFPKWWRDAVWFGDKKTPVGAQNGGV